MRELIKALANLTNAKAEQIREQTRCYELGIYGKGLVDGRADVEEADYTFIYGTDEDEDCE